MATAEVPVAQPVKPRRSILGTLRYQFSRLGWPTRMLFIGAILLAAVGVAGMIAGKVQPEPPQKQQAQATVESLKVPAGQQLTPTQQAQLDNAKEQVKQYGHWFYDKTAPTLAKVGSGFAVAFVLGLMARTFVKTVAMISAAVLTLAGVAAYFGVVDLGQFRSNFTNSTGQLMDQMQGVKDLILKSIGASLSGAAGFAVGFLRR